MSLHIYDMDYWEEWRTNEVAHRTEELMKQGEECDPYHPGNFGEALAELSAEQIEYLAKMASGGLRTLLGTHLREYVVAYWRKHAQFQAEQATPCTRELYSNALADAAEAREDR